MPHRIVPENYLACVVLGVMVYFIVLIALRGLSKSEINFFINVVREALRSVLPGGK
jgi:hypothetical protein